MSAPPDAFDMAFTALCELHGKEPSPSFYMLYREALVSELGEEGAVFAIKASFKSKTFGFPKPGDLIDLVHGKQEDKALAAWEQLQQAVSRAGAYQSVLFEDPKIARVIKILGGWEAVCGWPVAELQYRRHEFLQAYKALPASCPQEALAGIADRSNAALGYPKADPVFIGSEHPKPALPDRSAAEALPPGDDDRVPIREVIKALNEDLFGNSARDGWLLKQ
ncbi:MAG: DUF6475 domain-containing protein [Syntrophobacteraceae bacterium]